MITRLTDLTEEHIGAGGEPDGGVLMLAMFKRACERYQAQHGGSEGDAIDAIWGQGDFGERMYAQLTEDEIRTLESPPEELQGPGGLR